MIPIDELETNEVTQSPSDITDALNSINKSLAQNFAGFIALTLSTYAYIIKRQELFCTVKDEPCCDCLPDVFNIKLAAYIIALAIAVSDHSTNVEAVSEPAETSKEQLSNELSYTSSLLVLIAAVIDVINLLLTGQESEPPVI